MQKIISLYQRNYETDRLVRNEITPGAEWVISGEGVATKKFDGTCCMIKDGEFFKRYDAKHGKKPPVGFIASQAADPVTGHFPGWIPVGGGPDDKYHRDAFIKGHDFHGDIFTDGTYELIGPAINKNPERIHSHCLVSHSSNEIQLDDAPRDYYGLMDWFLLFDIEGVVWHHPDGRMVKIKKKDFGFNRW